MCFNRENVEQKNWRMIKRDWNKSPSLSIVFGLSSKTQWLSGLYYADFISFYSPTQLCGGGTTKSNSNELPISVPLSFACSLVFAVGVALVVPSVKADRVEISSTTEGTKQTVA